MWFFSSKNKKTKIDVGHPGPWESGGSVVLARKEVERVCDAADLLRKRLKSETLDPANALVHAAKIQIALDMLIKHASDPTKYNAKPKK